MKIGTLCKVTAKNSHHPSQFGDLIVVTRGATKKYSVVTGTNLNTGREHHYFTSEIKEVKQ